MEANSEAPKTYFAHSRTARSDVHVWLGILICTVIGGASAYAMRARPVMVIGVLVAVVALFDQIRSVIFNRPWSLRVYDDWIAWSTPSQENEVKSAAVEAAHFANVGESDTLYLLKKDGGVLKIHYDCFGFREKELVAALLEQNPSLRVTKGMEFAPWTSWQPFRRKRPVKNRDQK